MKKTKCNSKDELITTLKNWLKTNENTIGNGEIKTGNTKIIFLKLNDNKYYINADTTREGIEVFVKNHEENNSWMIIQNNRGVHKKISNDINSKTIKGLYFYSESIGQREI